MISETIQRAESAIENKSMIPKADLQSLVGKELWVTHVAVDLATHLSSSYAMVKAETRAPRVFPSKKFIADQKAILGALNDGLKPVPLISSSVFPELDAPTSTVIFGDACSTGVGGFIILPFSSTIHYIGEQFPEHLLRAMRADPQEWHINPAELLTEFILVSIASDLVDLDYVTVFTDNEAARAAATAGRSSSNLLNPIAEALDLLVSEISATLRSLRVTTHENEIADQLSRGNEIPLQQLAAAAGADILYHPVPPHIWDMATLM